MNSYYGNNLVPACLAVFRRCAVRWYPDYCVDVSEILRFITQYLSVRLILLLPAGSIIKYTHTYKILQTKLRCIVTQIKKSKRISKNKRQKKKQLMKIKSKNIFDGTKKRVKQENNRIAHKLTIELANNSCIWKSYINM